jgi:hypothetical protein
MVVRCSIAIICIHFIVLINFIVALLLVSTFVIVASRKLEKDIIAATLSRRAKTPTEIQQSSEP